MIAPSDRISTDTPSERSRSAGSSADGTSVRVTTDVQLAVLIACATLA